ncbi:MAG: B12-binding domain-containing radical SAM protein [bacterium]|nr:B12-binding domain-containing radical SAM protein [bacterium]
MTRSRPLDLLLINPGGQQRIYQNLSTNLAAKEPPIWAGLLATYARNKGHSVAILDANALDLSPAEVAEQVAELRPLLTAVVVYGHNPNASTFAMPGAGDVCSAVKEADPEGRVILLGGHVSALPERTLAEEDVDFVCGGEGGVTLHELIGALRATPSRPELTNVRGLWWRDGGTAVRNPAAPLVRDLAREMPGMAWDLLDMTQYRAHNWHCFGRENRAPYAALYTTLGCPFTCTFCCIQAPFKSGEAASGLDPKINSYRRFDPDHVVEQIGSLWREHGIQNIKVADELFLLDRRHVSRICDGLSALHADLNIWAYARVDTCNDAGLLVKMREAGVRWLAIGIESASERVRADVDKGYRPDAIEQAIGRVRDAGIHVMGNYIFGLPEDDRTSMRQTLDFAKSLNTEFANFFSAMAYPGSQLYRDAVERGWPLPETWDGYSQHSRSCLPLPTRHLSGGEVLAFRDTAFREYFDRDEYRTMVRGTFGEAAGEEIERMLGHDLDREHASSTGSNGGASREAREPLAPQRA